MAVLKIKDANGNWQNIVALKGDQGERGPEGPVGPAGGVNSVNGMTGDVTISLTKSNVTNALGYTPVKTVNGATPDSSGNVTLEIDSGSADSLSSKGGTFDGTMEIKAATSSKPAKVGSVYHVESGKAVVFGNPETFYGSSAGAGLEIDEDSVSAVAANSNGVMCGFTASTSAVHMLATNGTSYNCLILNPDSAVPMTLKGNLVVSVNGVKADANGNVALDGVGGDSGDYLTKDSITYGTTDLTAGTSELATGSIYLMYE